MHRTLPTTQHTSPPPRGMDRPRNRRRPQTTTGGLHLQSETGTTGAQKEKKNDVNVDFVFHEVTSGCAGARARKPSRTGPIKGVSIPHYPRRIHAITSTFSSHVELDLYCPHKRLPYLQCLHKAGEDRLASSRARCVLYSVHTIHTSTGLNSPTDASYSSRCKSFRPTAISQPKPLRFTKLSQLDTLGIK
jgi:hypothetical protein